jgi:hypothetical protein
MTFTNLSSIHFELDYSTMHSTLQDSSSIPPIPKLQDNDTLGGMQDLTSAIQEMDNMLWRMQTRLLRVDGLDDLAGRWRNVDEVRLCPFLAHEGNAD